MPLELEWLLFATVAVIVLEVWFVGTDVDCQTPALGRAVSEQLWTAESSRPRVLEETGGG